MGIIVNIDDYFEQEEKPTLSSVSRNQIYYGARVDYNLKNISSHAYAYFEILLESLYKTVVASKERITTVWFYMRCENELKKCNIFECKKILWLIDEYLQRIHVQESQEKEFFTRIRNIVFIKHQKYFYSERYD